MAEIDDYEDQVREIQYTLGMNLDIIRNSFAIVLFNGREELTTHESVELLQHAESFGRTLDSIRSKINDLSNIAINEINACEELTNMVSKNDNI